jgi:hypothetical protein
MPEINNLEHKKLKIAWWKGTIAIYLIYPLIVISVGAILTFALQRGCREKPHSQEIEIAPIQYESKGEKLLKIIKYLEGKTDYDIIAAQEIEQIRIYGNFEGKDWVHILKKIIHAYDKQLTLYMDEKNKKITITFKKR